MKTKRKNIFKSLVALTIALIMVLGVAPLNELAGVDIRLRLESHGRAVFDGRPQDVACGNCRYVEYPAQNLCLSTFTGAGCAEKNKSHRHLADQDRKPL